MKPIEVFKSDEQLTKAMFEWKEVLMLDGWTIVVRLSSLEELKIESGIQCVGESKVDYINKCSIIHIADGEQLPVTAERFCAEETLVHELLHCKYNVLHDEESYEGAMLDVHQHQLLEEMAKSLIMTKYNLPFSYWKNPFWDTEFSYEYTED